MVAVKVVVGGLTMTDRTMERMSHQDACPVDRQVAMTEPALSGSYDGGHVPMKRCLFLKNCHMVRLCPSSVIVGMTGPPSRPSAMPPKTKRSALLSSMLRLKAFQGLIWGSSHS